MKRTISDMLDAYSGAELNVEMQTPLSSERIRELTMSRISKKEHRSRRIALRVLAAAAIIAALTVSAIAAGTGSVWFLGFFGKQEETELTEGQIEFVDENAVDLNKGQTIDGYNVTLESHISDGAKTYLKFRIRAPEGVELPKVIFGSVKPYVDGELLWSGMSQRWGRLDTGEKEGTGIYLLTIDGQPMDSGNIVLTLTDLEYFDYVGRVIVEGTWSFDLSIPDTREIELIKEPLEGVQCRNQEGEQFEVNVTSARLRVMSLKIQYEECVKKLDSDHTFDAVKAIMSDGSIVELNWDGSEQHSDDDGVHLSASFAMRTPLELNEIVRIEFPGGIQIPVDPE